MYAFLMNVMSRMFGKTAKENMRKLDPNLQSKVNNANRAIDNICQMMPDDSSSNNWRGNFDRMKEKLDEMPNSYGLSSAKDIWDGMHGGMGSWNDYYIPHDNQKTMTKLNDDLERECAALSVALNIE